MARTFTVAGIIEANPRPALTVKPCPVARIRAGNSSANVGQARAAVLRRSLCQAADLRGIRGERSKYAIRIPANDSLERDIAELLTRACGKTEPQAGGLVQGLPLPSRELEDGSGV